MPTIKKLHRTLKACKCGFIGTRGQLYKHFTKEEDKTVGSVVATARKDWELAFYANHGEVPLNEDDPRTKVGEQLKESLKQ